MPPLQKKKTKPPLFSTYDLHNTRPKLKKKQTATLPQRPRKERIDIILYSTHATLRNADRENIMLRMFLADQQHRYRDYPSRSCNASVLDCTYRCIGTYYVHSTVACPPMVIDSPDQRAGRKQNSLHARVQCLTGLRTVRIRIQTCV